MKTEEQKARARERYARNREKHLARRRARLAALSPEELEARRERVRAQGRARYARDRALILAKQREKYEPKRQPPAPPPEPYLEPDPAIPGHYTIPAMFTSEAAVTQINNRLRNALVRLVSAARSVQDLANIRFGYKAMRTYDLLEKHVLECYAKQYGLLLHLRDED